MIVIGGEEGLMMIVGVVDRGGCGGHGWGGK